MRPIAGRAGQKVSLSPTLTHTVEATPFVAFSAISSPGSAHQDRQVPPRRARLERNLVAAVHAQLPVQERPAEQLTAVWTSFVSTRVRPKMAAAHAAALVRNSSALREDADHLDQREQEAFLFALAQRVD